MPFSIKSRFPVKWILNLNAISNEVAFSQDVAYLFPLKWFFSYEAV